MNKIILNGDIKRKCIKKANLITQLEDYFLQEIEGINGEKKEILSSIQDVRKIISQEKDGIYVELNIGSQLFLNHKDIVFLDFFIEDYINIEELNIENKLDEKLIELKNKTIEKKIDIKNIDKHKRVISEIIFKEEIYPSKYNIEIIKYKNLKTQLLKDDYYKVSFKDEDDNLYKLNTKDYLHFQVLIVIREDNKIYILIE